MHDIITQTGSGVACYVSDGLEFHRPGLGLSNVRTERGNEAAGTEKDMAKSPEGHRECTLRELPVGKNKNIKSFTLLKNDCHFIKNVCVYVTNILTEINLIFTFYSGYWLSLSPVMVF